jgi:hypothetical protein
MKSKAFMVYRKEIFQYRGGSEGQPAGKNLECSPLGEPFWVNCFSPRLKQRKSPLLLAEGFSQA